MVRAVLAALVACAMLCRGADTGRPVHELVLMVRTAVQAKEPDSKLAKELRKFRLSEHLNDHAVEELMSVGAGPKAEEALAKLQQESAGLPEADLSTDFPHGPRPTIAQQQAIVDGARDGALAYAQLLPDFFCEEVIRRYEEFAGSWHLKDTLDVKLTYFEHREKYDLLQRNGRPTTKTFESVGGAISQGEFGSLLTAIFASDSLTRFRWDHWTTLRGRPAHVFQFRIVAAHSSYRIAYRMGDGSVHSAVTGQYGHIYIDSETHSTLKIESDADEIPRTFPVRMAHTVLNFGFTEIGGKQFLLPLRAEIRMGAGYLMTKNEVDFRGYRKFGSETTVTFR